MQEEANALYPSFVSSLGSRLARLDSAAIEHALRALLASARSAWPGIELVAEEFARELAVRLASNDDPLTALGKLHANDLFIACAVAHGVPGALAAFEGRFFPEVSRAVALHERSPAFADDVQQILRERLFLRGPDKSAIAQYGGKGPLAKWLRISALRVASRLRESREQETDLDRLHKIADRALVVTASDPELDYLKATYRKEFRQAFHDALAVLSPRERNVLRLCTLDGLTGGEIAAFYGVSPSSASRWMSHAKETLHLKTRELLSDRLCLGASQLDSLAGLVLSQLDLSLGRVLQE